jgi:adenylate cyclase class IV
MKVREEREVEIESADEARALFENLGYAVVRRYQKMREEWQLGGVTIALDHTPIGDFAEFEGDGAETVAKRCGLDPDQGEKRSYLRLYEDYLKEHPDAPPEMVFR